MANFINEKRNGNRKALPKAKIIVLDEQGGPDYEIPCQFNPTEYSYSKQNSWKQATPKGKEVPSFEFSSGQPATLKMQFFFDTTESGDDVRVKHTEKLWDLMRVTQKPNGSNTGEPPKCWFVWGNKHFFTAVVTNISQKFTLFDVDGTPLRATLDITFQQVKDDSEYGPQNPTSRSEPRKTRRVILGDRIDLISFEEYGDTRFWLDLALANDLEDPLALQPGQILNIPNLL